MSENEASDSTTRPNSPEPAAIEDENEPCGDFARLYPRSRAARLAFHYLAICIEQNPGIYRWQRRFIHIRQELEELEPDATDDSTGDERLHHQRIQSSFGVASGD